MGHFFFFFVFNLIFIRVYLSQSDDICWGARSQMLPQVGYFLVESPRNLCYSQKRFLSFPLPTKWIQIPSRIWGGISGRFELTILMPLCSLTVHTARGLGESSCETGRKVVGSDWCCTHHAFHQYSLLLRGQNDVTMIYSSSLHFNSCLFQHPLREILVILRENGEQRMHLALRLRSAFLCPAFLPTVLL